MEYYELQENIQNALNESITNIVKEKTKEIVQEFVTSTEFTDLLNSFEVRKVIHDNIRNFLPTEIGNRLRCGVYEGTVAKRAFEEVFPDAVNKDAIDRVRGWIQNEVKVAIKEKVEDMFSRIKTNL